MAKGRLDSTQQSHCNVTYFVRCSILLLLGESHGGFNVLGTVNEKMVESDFEFSEF